MKRISMSEKLNELSDDTARLLYTWMLAHLDKNGVYYSDPNLIKNTIFPWRSDMSFGDILSYVNEMEELGLIERFKDGGNYLFYPDFKEKQPYLRSDKENTDFPPPPIPVSVGKQSGKSTLQSKIKESKVKEYNGEFDTLWKAYGYSRSKQGSTKAFTKAIKEGTLKIPEDMTMLLKAITNYRKSIMETKTTQKHLAFWISDKRWEDEYEPEKPTSILEGAVNR